MATQKNFLNRLKWRTEWLSFMLLEWIFRALPLRIVCRLGRGIGGLAWRMAAGRRQIIERNLRIAFAKDMSPAEHQALSQRVMKRSAENLLASLKTATITQDELSQAIEMEGIEHFQQAKAQGKGVIVVLAHTGNWEILAQLGPLLDDQGPLGALYRPLTNPYLNQTIVTRRERRGTRLFAKFSDLSGLTGLLRQGGTLGILCDQRAGKHGHRVPFFYRDSSFSPLPVLLARRTGAALISIGVQTISSGKWKIKIDPQIPPDPVANTADIARRIEAMIRRSPEDYFWLQERWKLPRRNPFAIIGKGELMQAIHHPVQETHSKEAAIIGDIDLPQPVDGIKTHRLPIASTAELEAQIRELHESAPTGLDFVVGPRDLIQKLDISIPSYDESLRLLSR